jgi:hypothetical protein
MWPFKKRVRQTMEEFAATFPPAPCGEQTLHYEWEKTLGMTCPRCAGMKEAARKEAAEDRLAEKTAKLVLAGMGVLPKPDVGPEPVPVGDPAVRVLMAEATDAEDLVLPDGATRHTGSGSGRNPVPKRFVQVWFKSGARSLRATPSESWGWGDPDLYAYKVVPKGTMP